MSKSKFRLFLIALFLVSGVYIFHASPAKAAINDVPDCSEKFYDRCLYAGYFTGARGEENITDNTIFPLGNYFAYSDDLNGVPSLVQWAFPELSGSSTKNATYTDKFLNLLDGYVNADYKSCTTDVDTHIMLKDDPNGISQGSACFNMRRDAIGAAFIINTVIGSKGSAFGGGKYGTAAYTKAYENGILAAQLLFPQFSSLIKQYDSLGLIDWNYDDTAPKNHINTTGINWGTDIQFFHATASYNFKSIRIRNTSGSVLYEINRGCANVANHFGPVPQFHEFNVTAAPSVKLLNSADEEDAENPAKAEFSFDYTATGTPINNVEFKAKYKKIPQSTGLPGTTDLDSSHPDDTYNVDIPLTGDPPAFPPSMVTISTGSLSVGDAICMIMDVKYSNGEANEIGDVNSTPAPVVKTFSNCARVVNRPYLSIYGGDAITGGTIDDGSIHCGSASSISPIATFLNSSNKGAGVQLAALATGNITNFATAKIRSSDPKKPSGLSFSNNSGSGNFGAQNCVSGYVVPNSGTSTIDSSDTTDLSTLATGSYYSNGDLIIEGGKVKNRRNITIRVKGDISITGTKDNGILFKNPTSWNSSDKIPSLTIIASGNIYIGKDVQELNGVYVSHGTINTCANGFGNYDGATSDLYTTCNKQLVVYGSLIANNIKWLRTYKSLKDGTSGENPYPGNVNAAELIIHGPELYLANPNNSLPGSSTKYESISSLPPVL